MKYLIFLLAISFTQVSLSNDIKEKRGKFKYPKNQEIVDEYFFNRKLLNNINIANKLAAIKYQIINGNLEKAKVLLLQAKYTDDFSKSIQFRYLGIIHFIEGNYKSSQEFLTKKEMYQIQNTSKICLLRTLNYVILENIPNAKLEWNRCVDATVNKSPTNHVWMTTLLKLKMNDEANITKVPFKAINIENEEGNFLRLYLKLSLYLNQQQKVLKRIPLLTIEAYQDEEIRELIGLLYYRRFRVAQF